MTMTHMSHFGLEQIGETSDNVLLLGTLANCKRMAFAHGCTIAREEGRILGMDGRNAICDSTKITAYWLTHDDIKHAGVVIFIDPKGWVLILDRRIWDAN